MRRMVACAAACSLALGAASALACGNSVRLEIRGPERRVNGAELLVRAGDSAKAFRAAWRVARKLGRQVLDLPVENADEVNALRRRARRVMAIAQVRASGHLGATGRLLKRVSTRRRRVKLRWARIVLRRQWRAHRKDPLLRARYAEALAQSPSKRLRARALKLLQSLATKDLMPDAWAYRTLAQLHHARNDTAARDAAVAKCRLKAGAKAAAICPTFGSPRTPVG